MSKHHGPRDEFDKDAAKEADKANKDDKDLKPFDSTDNDDPSQADVDAAKADKKAAHEEIVEDTKDRKANELVDAQKSARAPVPEGPHYYAGNDPLPSETTREQIGQGAHAGLAPKQNAMTELRKYHDELNDQLDKLADELGTSEVGQKFHNQIGKLKNHIVKINGVYDGLDPEHVRRQNEKAVVDADAKRQQEPKI